jgi:hypothetical protein
MAHHSEVRMNSIDQQQPEETRDHLQGQQAIDRIREMAKDSESCFFCTALSLSETGATRPTSVQEADERGPLVVPKPFGQREEPRAAAERRSLLRTLQADPATGRRWLSQ